MKAERRNWLVLAACCVSTGALGLTGCAGTKIAKTDGSGGSGGATTGTASGGTTQVAGGGSSGGRGGGGVLGTGGDSKGGAFGTGGGVGGNDAAGAGGNTVTLDASLSLPDADGDPLPDAASAALDSAPDTTITTGTMLVSCPFDTTVGPCEDLRYMLNCGGCRVPSDVKQYYCLEGDARTVCWCDGGEWQCPRVACPDVVKHGDLCIDSAVPYCLDSYPSPGHVNICRCTSTIVGGDVGVQDQYSCWTANFSSS
jgi:hypothetical protein